MNLYSRPIVFVLLLFSFLPIKFQVGFVENVSILDVPLSLVLLLYAIQIALGRKILAFKIDILFFLFGTLSLLSLICVVGITSPDFTRIKTALGGLVMMWLFLSVVWIFSNAYATTGLLRVVARYYYYFSLISSLALSVIIITLGPGKHDEDLAKFSMFNISFAQPLYAYGYSLGRCIMRKKWPLKDMVILILCSIIPFLSFYRSIWVEWLVITLFLLTVRRFTIAKTAGIAFAVLMVLGSAGLIMYSLFPDVMQMLLIKNIDEVIAFFTIPVSDIEYLKSTVTIFGNKIGATRAFLWLQAMPYIHTSPWFGHGVGFEAYLGATLQLITVISTVIVPVATFHNHLLSLAVDYGIMGIILLYGFLITVAWKIRPLLAETECSPENIHAIYCFFTAFIIFFVSSFIGGNIIPAHPSMYAILPFWLFLGAALAEHKRAILKRVDAA